MPAPGKGESRDEYLERCIPKVLEDGTAEDSDQAVAICSSMWRDAKDGKMIDSDNLIIFGSEVKALGDGKVGGYLVRFTGPDEPDLEYDYFDAKTYYGSVTTSPVHYNHGLDPVIGLRELGTGSLETKDAGVWIEAQLELRDEYERAVYALAEKGKLGWSSGTAPHLVEREEKGKAYHVTRWPLGLDASLTPTPADPGNRAMPLKTWAQQVKSINLEVGPEATVTETVAAATTDDAADVHVRVTVETKAQENANKTEGKPMSEKTEDIQAPEPVDVEAIATATQAVKAFWEQIQKDEKRPSGAGYVTEVTDEADRALEGRPFKGLGEFLMTVKAAGMGGGVDKRLLPLRSNDPATEGGFSVFKAVPGIYGSLSAVDSHVKGMKVPSGLGLTPGSLGGFLVDSDRRLGIMERMYDIGQLLQRVSMFPVSANSNSMTFNADAETSRVDGSRRGGVRAYWTAEAGTKTASYPSFRQIKLELNKLVGLVYATDELLADAAALESYILRILPEELNFGVEDAIVNGTGTGMPLGILAAGCLISVAKETGQAATTLVSENIIKMWARMWAPSRRNAVWLINQDVEPQMYQFSLAVGTGGSVVYMPPGGLSAAPYGTLFGRPVIPVEYCATLGTQGDIILADLSQYYMIEKGGIEATSSIHVRFVYDETTFRFVYRVDGQPSWASALTPYKGTNTVGPFIVLDARS